MNISFRYDTLKPGGSVTISTAKTSDPLMGPIFEFIVALLFYRRVTFLLLSGGQCNSATTNTDPVSWMMERRVVWHVIDSITWALHRCLISKRVPQRNGILDVSLECSVIWRALGIHCFVNLSFISRCLFWMLQKGGLCDELFWQDLLSSIYVWV